MKTLQGAFFLRLIKMKNGLCGTQRVFRQRGDCTRCYGCPPFGSWSEASAAVLPVCKEQAMALE